MRRHERLGARADEAVDRVGPAVGVAEREAAEREPEVAAEGEAAHEVAREHDLLHLARADGRDGARDGPLVVVGTHGSGAQVQPVLGAGALGHGDGARGQGVERGRDVAVLLVGQSDPRDPRHPVPTADHDARHDEHARGLRVVREGEGAERDEARAGDPERIRHGRGRGHLAPRRGGVPHAIGPAELEAEGLADAAHPGSVPEPQERVPGVEEGDEPGDGVDGGGVDEERSDAGCGHGCQPTAGDPGLPGCRPTADEAPVGARRPRPLMGPWASGHRPPRAQRARID